MGLQTYIEPNWLTAGNEHGFYLVFTRDLQEFVDTLPRAKVAFVFSGSPTEGDNSTWQDVSEADFVAAVTKFHESGGGLGLFANGAPCLTEANSFLSTFGIQLTGRDFGRTERPVTSNAIIRSLTLYEGLTMSYPVNDYVQDFHTILTSSTNHPSIFVKNRDAKGHGRILVDTSYNKAIVGGSVLTYLANISSWLFPKSSN